MKTREGSLLLLSSWPCSFFCSPLAWSYPLSESLGGTGYTSALGARFSKGPETFRARKAIFSLSVSKNREVCTPETPCMKGTSVHIKNMWIKQLCNRKVRDFAMAFRARKVSGAFEKRAPGLELGQLDPESSALTIRSLPPPPPPTPNVNWARGQSLVSRLSLVKQESQSNRESNSTKHEREYLT